MTRTFAEFGIEAVGQGEIDVTCPKCSLSRRNKRARCLSVNTDKGAWICHHCGWRGSLEFGEEEASRPPRRFVPPTLPALVDLPAEVIAWFESRAIPQRILARNNVVYGPAYFPQIEDRRGAMQFPYFRGEDLVNVKYRTKDKHFRMHGGAERILYGINDVAEITVIVEGEIDKLSCEAAGYLACVSVPDGAPPPNAKGYASKFDFLDADAKRLEVVKTWILAVDNDEPGKALEAELVRRFGPERCRRVEWPAGCKDANEVLVRFGFDRLKTCLDEAKPYPIEGLFTVDDISDLIDDLYDRGLPGGEKTGWPSVDRLYTVRAGEWTLVTGVPSHGKSTWLDALLVNLIDREKGSAWRIGIYSPENLPLQRHFASLAEKLYGEPFRGTDRMDRELLNAAKYTLQESVVFILPAQPTVDSILDRTRIAVARRGISGLVIDPFNELEHARPARLTETEYISETLTKIRRFARDHRIHVWLVAHPTKLQKDRKTGEYPIPTPYDVSGSAHWRNKADNCITIWRDVEGDRNSVQIHVQKVRFREIGQPGVAVLRYDPRNGRFTDTNQGLSAGYDSPAVPSRAPERPRHANDDLPEPVSAELESNQRESEPMGGELESGQVDLWAELPSTPEEEARAELFAGRERSGYGDD